MQSDQCPECFGKEHHHFLCSVQSDYELTPMQSDKSDTPRTDAAREHLDDLIKCSYTLERSNNELRAEMERLKARIDSVENLGLGTIEQVGNEFRYIAELLCPDYEGEDSVHSFVEQLQSEVSKAESQLKTAREALRDAEMFISADYIDWDKSNASSPDFDRNYKPEFPPIVQQLQQALSNLEEKKHD